MTNALASQTATSRSCTSRPRSRLVLERLEDRCLLDASYFPLVEMGLYWQDWSDTSLIGTTDDWSGVPSVIGYRGDGLTGSVGVDPRTVTAFAGAGGPVVNVLANRNDPDTLTTGGVAEFEGANPAVALQGSGTARAPFLLFHMNTSGTGLILLYLELYDLDGSDDNALSQVTVQYRVGETGSFSNVPDTYVADASAGPNESGQMTPVIAILPADADNRERVQLRVLTTDAQGSDEWIGVDTVFMIGLGGPPPPAQDLRLAVYNIASTDGFPRAGLDTILAGIGAERVNGSARPLDILALQEVRNQVTTTEYVVSLMNGMYGAGVYARGNLNGGSTGGGTQGIVYNTQTVQLLAEATVGTASSTGQPRQALRYHFRPVGTDGSADFYVYNSHFKAVNDTPSRNRRLVEANALRANADALGPGANVIFVGDFNVYTSTEPAYQRLLAAGDSQALDPLGRPGNWHSNAAFVDLFTQAPAVDPPPGMAGGGLDDRFDFQLFTGALLDGYGLDYRDGTYHTFGVNGSVPVNRAVNDFRSTALPDLPDRLTILDTLAAIADHLPVVADYVIYAGLYQPPRSPRELRAPATPPNLGDSQVATWLSQPAERRPPGWLSVETVAAGPFAMSAARPPTSGEGVFVSSTRPAAAIVFPRRERGPRAAAAPALASVAFSLDIFAGPASMV